MDEDRYLQYIKYIHKVIGICMLGFCVSASLVAFCLVRMEYVMAELSDAQQTCEKYVDREFELEKQLDATTTDLNFYGNALSLQSNRIDSVQAFLVNLLPDHAEDVNDAFIWNDLSNRAVTPLPDEPRASK